MIKKDRLKQFEAIHSYIKMVDYKYIDRGLYFPQSKTYIASDIHFSHENIHKTASSVKNRLSKICSEYNIETLILNGDTFTEFPFPQEGVSALKSLQTEVNSIILLEGNHERSVGGFGQLKNDFTTRSEYMFETNNETIVVTHGDTLPQSNGDVYIIGHLHTATNGVPSAIKFNSGYAGSPVIALPSFTESETMPLSESATASPLLSPRQIQQDKYQIEERF